MHPKFRYLILPALSHPPFHYYHHERYQLSWSSGVTLSQFGIIWGQFGGSQYRVALMGVAILLHCFSVIRPGFPSLSKSALSSAGRNYKESILSLVFTLCRLCIKLKYILLLKFSSSNVVMKEAIFQVYEVIGVFNMHPNHDF